jgi:spore coat protein U-like protein
MKKYILAVAVLMLVVAMTGTAMAAGSQTVGVSATVLGVCQFLTGGTVAFGTLDPSIGGNINGTVTQPTFWCTRGTSYTITDDSGLHELVAGSPRMVSGTSPTDFIPYSFTYTATGTGSGRGTPINMNIASTVVAADYLNALAGAYADTVTLTINP